MNTNNTPTTQSLETLQIEVWNAYKDAYGFRPRHLTQSEWDNVAFLEKTLQNCIEAM